VIDDEVKGLWLGSVTCIAFSTLTLLVGGLNQYELMSLHHYGCVTPCLVNILQKGWFWTASLASLSSMLNDERSSEILPIQVEHGCLAQKTQMPLREIDRWVASGFFGRDNLSIYIYVCLCVCLPDFSKTCGPISMKLFMVRRVIGRRERTKKHPKNFIDH